MDTTKPIFKFKTNIPVTIHFESDLLETEIGQYGGCYRYDIIFNGQGYSLFASEGLQKKLLKLGNLKGQNLEITKREGEGSRIFWEIIENGIDITSSIYDAKTQETQERSPREKTRGTSVPRKIPNIEKRLDNASDFVKNLSLRLDRVEKEINELRAHMKT